jgi:hypothetical protein
MISPRSLLSVMLLLPLAASAQDIGMVTVMEGQLRVIRGVTVLQGAEGMRIHGSDIIESSDAGFAQLEFAGGTIVALGSSSRVLLSTYAGKAAKVALLDGWLKSQSGSNAGVSRYDTPLLAATTQAGVLVLHSTPSQSDVFVESGSARIGEVSRDGALRTPRPAKQDQFFSRISGKNISDSPRPSADFVGALPRQFRDTFPALASRFTGKPPEPKRAHAVSYSEIQPWLTVARQDWRSGFVRRFQPRLNDPAFRRALEANLKEHPEWEPLLHPELYQPRNSPKTTGNPDPNSGRSAK